MNNQLFGMVLLVCVGGGLFFAIGMWGVGVVLIIRERRKPASFITQEMKRLEDKGKTK